MALEASRAAQAENEESRVSSIVSGLRKAIFDARARRNGEKQRPPSEPPSPPIATGSDDDEYDDIELLGRTAAFDPRDWAALQRLEVRVVRSSNVYGYFFEPEPPSKLGILYVTFLNWEPGMKSDERSGPGPTYAYYDFPEAKYRAFAREAASSAGKAVWDFCRIRHTVEAHQHRYELIQVAGDYVPRRATKKGFSTRTLVAPGLTPAQRKKIAKEAGIKGGQGSSQFFKRNTLAPRAFHRGEPNRGEPNRGR